MSLTNNVIFLINKKRLTAYATGAYFIIINMGKETIAFNTLIH